MRMTKRSDYAQEVASKFIEMIEAGTAPWQRDWKPGELHAPVNLSSGNAYRGVNSLWLMSKGYADPRWMTYKQAKAQGYQVRKGEHGTRIMYFSDTIARARRDEEGAVVKDKNGNTVYDRFDVDFPVFNTFTVFNASQITGITPWVAPEISPEQLWENHQRAEALIQNSGAKVIHESGLATPCYRPLTDTVHLPVKSQFANEGGYYSTAFHELSHWTGHPERLNRNLEGIFSTTSYAQEELRAEIGQFMVCQSLGIGYEAHRLENTAAYLESWVKNLADRPQEMLYAAADSQKIEKYLMNFAPPVKEQTLRQGPQLDESDKAFYAQMAAKATKDKAQTEPQPRPEQAQEPKQQDRPRKSRSAR